MTARINTTVHNVPVTFGESVGTVDRAEIVETSLPGANQRSAELTLSGLPDRLREVAAAAHAQSRAVEVRVLGFYGSWTVSDIVTMPGNGETFLRLKSAGPVMAAMP